VTKEQVVLYWYSFLNKEFKTLVEDESLRLEIPFILRYVWKTLELIEINLLEEQATMDFLTKDEKVLE
jgi:hypothetical protein